MRSQHKTLAAAAVLALTAAASASGQTRPTPQRPARPAVSSDAAEGRRVFDAQCAWCHGNEGDGGMGPNLHGKLHHAASLASIVDIITNGIPGTDMPGFRSPLTERNIRQSAAYVQSLSRTSAPPAAGNAQRGAALYGSTGCAACHVVAGQGGILGPELTTIGARRGAAYLREAIVKPESSHPPGYLVVRATPVNGPEVRGIRVTEDVFWVHIRDSSGAVHAFQKSDLKSLDREIDASLMPSYASRLKDAELDDLVAYLTTLRGAK
ncbi:MAG TPA: c-type cytochrome [Vicinamibacterales bacterium]|nr:c-type cytochrome [Vicinamibacterales bacterium]